MHKILTVAKREYGAAVKTKAFLVSLLLMPLLMFGGLLVQKKTQSLVDTSTYKVAILDRTAGGKLATAIVEAAAQRNVTNRDSDGKAKGATFVIEIVVPQPASDVAAADLQRLELSDRTRSKELLAFVDIGPKVTEATQTDMSQFAIRATTQIAQSKNGSSDSSLMGMVSNALDQIESLPPEAQIRYFTSQPTLTVFRSWLQSTIQVPIVAERMRRSGLTPEELRKAQLAQFPMAIPVDRGMAERAPDGSIVYEANNATMIVNWMVPITLVMLMFIAVMVGASPLATNIVEEKQLRIAEVLLGGLKPFELMLGKLLGGAAVSITLACIYFVGIFFAARQFDVLQYVRVETIAWFILFTLIGVMTYGSLFVAAGAAATNIKEAQATLTPVMLVVAMPFFILTWIMQYPNGLLSKSASYFPLTAPTVSIIRSAIPQGASRLELTLSALCAIVGMLVIIWIAGRVFRAGMLLTSKPASVRELIGWIVRG